MINKTIADYEENDKLNIEEIIETYNGYIYTMLKNCISNKEDIEEVLSDVFVVLWKNYQKLDKTLKVKPYLIGITKNLIKKKYRISNLKNNVDNIDDYENEISSYIDIQNLAEQNEKSQIIQNMIDNMKKEEQRIFISFYYKGKKIKEISKEFDISEVKIKVILHRLRKNIKKSLKERGYDYGK